MSPSNTLANSGRLTTETLRFSFERRPLEQPPLASKGGPITGNAVSPIRNGRLSKHLQLPVDSRGSYLVLPAETGDAAGQSLGRRERKRANLLFDPVALYQSAAKIFASVESVPLILVTVGGMVAGTLAKIFFQKTK